MRGYGGLILEASASVRFVDAAEVDIEDLEILREISQQGANVVFLDWNEKSVREVGLFQAVAIGLGVEYLLPEGDYAAVQLRDHLITSAYRERGLVMIVDGADGLLKEKAREMFDLIEIFLTQIHHWGQQGKRCYLCFQISHSNDLVAFRKSLRIG